MSTNDDDDDEYMSEFPPLRYKAVLERLFAMYEKIKNDDFEVEISYVNGMRKHEEFLLVRTHDDDDHFKMKDIMIETEGMYALHIEGEVIFIPWWNVTSMRIVKCRHVEKAKKAMMKNKKLNKA